MAPRIYLAGPDVFLKDAVEIGQRKQRLCEEFGFEGLFPFDVNKSMEGDPDPIKIFVRNCELMESAAIGLFNLTPFRGVSADAGTIFELGFMFGRHQAGQRKLLYGYAGTQDPYATRVIRDFGSAEAQYESSRDHKGYRIEAFDRYFDNLMIVRAIIETGGRIITKDETQKGSDQYIAAFDAFEASLKEILRKTTNDNVK